MQAACLEIRRRNCGLNGRPVLFYAQRQLRATPSRPTKKRTVKKAESTQHAPLLDGLRSLGLVSIKAGQIEAAVKELYPRGIQGRDSGEVIRAVFLHVKRQHSTDKVGL